MVVTNLCKDFCRREGESVMDKIKIGLIGVGWIGSLHGHNVLKNPNAELVAIEPP